MNLLLYIQITERPEDVKFTNPIITTLKEKKIDFIFYDIDNHSDPFVINCANKLLSESDKKIIFIETETDSNFSKLIGFFTYLLDNPEGIEIFITGNNTKIKKMISILSHFTYTETTQKSEVINQILGKIL